MKKLLIISVTISFIWIAIYVDLLSKKYTDLEYEYPKISTYGTETLHIWSGWAGRCVYGKAWDFSFLSDPMTILSYVMAAYSSMDWMQSNGFIQSDFVADMTASVDSVTDSIGSMFKTDGGQAVSSGAAASGTTGGGFFDSLGDTAAGEGWYAVTYGDLAAFGLQSAFIMAAPSQK